MSVQNGSRRAENRNIERRLKFSLVVEKLQVVEEPTRVSYCTNSLEALQALGKVSRYSSTCI